jgi:hypothetical protein
MDELETALKKAKTRKACGPDGIPAEFYKSLNEEGKQKLLAIFNSILASEDVPKDWGDSTTVMIYKKGDPMDPINYRPISLLNIAMKLFVHILNARLATWASKNKKLPEEQAGFRAKRGCDEQIFNLNAAIQIGSRSKKKVYALFIDFKRAFPSVPHNRLWSKLHKIGVSTKFIRILQLIYQNATTKIRLSDGPSMSIPVTEGLLQGCVASPLLFTLYISDLIELIKPSGITGIDIGSHFTLHMLLFADDMVLLASSPRSLQLKINLIRKYFEDLGLHINLGKTKAIIFQRAGRRSAASTFKYGEEKIETVKEYEYLGVIFSNSCLFRKAADYAKQKGLKALGSLWNLFSSAKVLQWDTHKKLFDSLVSSVVLYSGHVWATHYYDIVERVQSQFLRRLFHLDFRCPTYAMRLETNSTKLQHTLAKMTVNFVIRILHMERSRIARISYEELCKTAETDQKRYNWVTGIREILNRTGHNQLCTSVDPSDWISSKAGILTTLQQLLRENDIDRAANSSHHKYATHIEDGQRITDFLSLGIKKASIPAQIRLNQIQFYWNSLRQELIHDQNCRFCNLHIQEDLFHFLVECRIHRPSQLRFMNPIFLIAIN